MESRAARHTMPDATFLPIRTWHRTSTGKAIAEDLQTMRCFNYG
jgi:hypothetical protein